LQETDIKEMIIITGAAGFIGSNLLTRLNADGYNDIVISDDFSREDKFRNTSGKAYTLKVNRNEFHNWLRENHKLVQYVFHLGARTDTSEQRKEIFDELNLDYSKEVWKICAEFGLPLVYASSAATYGLGEHGFADDHSFPPLLSPLNPYGESKNEFDKWVLLQERVPFFWAGLKFFNVYGPNEYHKGRMASVVFHAYNQIKKTGKMKLFRSHNPDYKDGEQKRDFIFVNDVVDVMCYLMHNRENSGIYNLGTGKARTFLDLVKATFKAMEIEENIEFIDTPEDIRDNYQYFTCADMGKLRKAGYVRPFTSLESGVNDYVTNFLVSGRVY
jgi:ADP-L-glycero-D-manno-heptose 6-epimerase